MKFFSRAAALDPHCVVPIDRQGRRRLFPQSQDLHARTMVAREQGDAGGSESEIHAVRLSAVRLRTSIVHRSSFCGNGNPSSDNAVFGILKKKILFLVTSFCFRILREYRVEWHHDPMEYVMSFVIAPAKPLRFRLVRHDA